MSAAESDAPAAMAEDATGALAEDAADEHETAMAYNEHSRVPWWVIAVWAITLIGFVTYLVRYLFPDLAQWGTP